MLRKTFAGVLGLAMVLTVVGGAVTPASAQTAAELQAQIASLLATIQALQAQLSSVTGGTTSTSCSFTFTSNLTVGSTGEQVRQLQKFLNLSADTQVSASGAGAPGSETAYFGPATRGAVAKFQAKHGISPAAGYFGPLTRTKVNSMCSTTSTPNVPVTGSVSVSLSPSTPASSALIQGQAIADLARFSFTNGSSAEARITNVVLNRTGVSQDTTLNNVYLYNGAVRVTDSATVSSGKITFNDPSGLFTIPAGQTVTISVKADIAGSTSGQIVGVQLVSATANVPVTGSLPVSGNTHTIASATMATVDFNSTTLPSASSVSAQDDYTVWQNTVTVGTRAVDLKAFSLRNVGSINTTDIRDFELYVDGSKVASAASMNANGYVTFDLSSNPVRLATGGRTIKVVADVVGGATRTFQFQLRQSSDVMLVDTELNQPVLPTANSSTFSARSATSATVSGASVSVTKANTSPSGSVALGATNVKIATFEVRASGEDVKIESLKVSANTSSTNDGLDNGKVFVNGVQVGSTKDLTEATDVEFTLGSSFIARAGQVETIDIYADAKDDDGGALTAGENVTITLSAGSSNGQGRTSLNSVNVPGSAVSGNAVTFSSSSLTVSKNTGYGNQTLLAGTTNAKVGSFTLTAGSAEAVNINTITVALSSDEAATVTDLMLKDASTGAQIGTTRVTPSTSNDFSVNFQLAASQSKTIDIVANLKSGANSGSWTANVDASGTGATTGSTSDATAVDVQTITLGSGSLSVSVAASDPDTANVVAGSTVKVGAFRFSAANSSYTIPELKLKVTSNAASSTNGLTIKYKNAAGATVEATAPVIAGSEANATSTFTGLSAFVPANDEMVVEVYANVPLLSQSGATGNSINVTLDYNEGFKAVDGSGSTATSVGSADVSSNGTFYARKSVPTFAKQSVGHSTPATGVALYKFTVSADAAGSVEWKKLSFTVATSGVTVDDLYLRRVGASSNVNDATVEGAGTVSVYAGTSANDDVESISAGSSQTYELFGTVTGWGSGDSLVISLTEDSSVAAPASSATLTSNNIIWSDRSATSHTTVTADWTNGYLLKDFSSDVQSYSQS